MKRRFRGHPGLSRGRGADPEHSDGSPRRRGSILLGCEPEKVQPKDFAEFDLLLAMDRLQSTIARPAPEGTKHKVRMFMSFGPRIRRDDVPDPYYGGRHRLRCGARHVRGCLFRG